jgi:hypothetical protein
MRQADEFIYILRMNRYSQGQPSLYSSQIPNHKYHFYTKKDTRKWVCFYRDSEDKPIALYVNIKNYVNTIDTVGFRFINPTIDCLLLFITTGNITLDNLCMIGMETLPYEVPPEHRRRPTYARILSVNYNDFYNEWESHYYIK